MFVLFVNDLPRTGRHGSTNMYADDTTLYAEAETAEQAMKGVSNHWNGIWNGTMEWKME